MKPLSEHRAVFLPAVMVALLTLTTALHSGDKPVNKEIGRTTERELNVVLSSGWGKVVIKRGGSQKIVTVDASPQNADGPQLDFSYAIRNRVGYLDVTLGEEKGGQHENGVFVVNNFDRSDWFLNFSDALPISFDIELGVGKGDFDLSGLQIKDFNLTTGASDVFLRFDQPNTTTIDNINIESGLSKFYGQNLGNANFRRFRFQGGVGTTTLDFSGALTSEVDVDVEVGLGSVKVIVPAGIGARILYEESWVSRFYCDKEFRKSGENTYVTDNYPTAGGKMNIRINSGLGSATVERR